ncbi:sulfur carrier protein ThiS [Pseudoramibacter sp.]|jgi:sulfur carrier protein|uniref:sulfur carrier protein ThiS n=1 Tax=Pseudoramibacter sp. TaxID=2034862 RepID=UPI0025DDCE3E|nr:sulfur carrier protein ThiS [Pseudoramibacter sp.]MCH4072303.1 sulfur carrier protein ThiS [Pseudoramibacter sp.]MCH4106074.1 sulfur carrier protein ThiS [Pseudoramibacter sp.]
MKITVSGEPTEVKEGISVAELIQEKDVENPQYVTVTVNDDFIDSGAFEEKTLSEGDQVEFLYFMGGGR